MQCQLKYIHDIDLAYRIIENIDIADKRLDCFGDYSALPIIIFVILVSTQLHWTKYR